MPLTAHRSTVETPTIGCSVAPIWTSLQRPAPSIPSTILAWAASGISTLNTCDLCADECGHRCRQLCSKVWPSVANPQRCEGIQAAGDADPVAGGVAQPDALGGRCRLATPSSPCAIG